jgi:hypothetical protein
VTDLQACQALLVRLDTGGKVTVGEVRGAIGKRNAADLNDELERARVLRAEADDATRGLRSYADLLRIADLLYGRAERLTNSTPADKLFSKAEVAYETALVVLGETLQFEPELHRHLDRVYDWGTNPATKLQADKMSVPRVRYHKRHVFGEVEHREVSSRINLIRTALQNAIADPSTVSMPIIEPAALTPDQADLLKHKLKALKSMR